MTAVTFERANDCTHDLNANPWPADAIASECHTAAWGCIDHTLSSSTVPVHLKNPLFLCAVIHGTHPYANTARCHSSMRSCSNRPLCAESITSSPEPASHTLPLAYTHILTCRLRYGFKRSKLHRRCNTCFSNVVDRCRGYEHHAWFHRRRA